MTTPRLRDLFGGFFTIGMLGFGGVLPMSRRVCVDQRCWLTPAEFTDLIALCQFLPGANVVNLAVALGGRFGGPAGAVAAVSGLLVGPVAVVIVLGALYSRYGAVPVVAHGFIGLTAAASGLALATALRVALPLRHHKSAIGIAAAAAFAVVVLQWPLLVVLAVLVPLGVAVAVVAG